MKKVKRQVVSFYDLPEKWQKEAISNSEDYEDISYLMPPKSHSPKKHILWDLSQCMRSGGEFDGIITVSNNSAVGVNLSDCGEEATLTFL
jgi:hypothetical protein